MRVRVAAPLPIMPDSSSANGNRARVAVLIFDQISTFHLAAPCTIFGERHPGVPAFDFLYCAVDAARPQNAAGLGFMRVHDLSELARADIVIVPGWSETCLDVPPALCETLRSAFASGATIVGLCLGTFVLAAAGLLHHRRATTHWAFAAELARRYPATEVRPNDLYAEDGAVLTSAGSGAALDCCLYLLGRLCGATVASGLARRLVLAAHRQGEQSQLLAQPFDPRSKPARMVALLEEIGGSLGAEHSIASSASRLAMSERSFTRYFRETTGTTLQRWLASQRLQRTRELLEQSHTTVESISHCVGFSSPASLRQSFLKAYGMTPSAWRKWYQAAGRTSAQTVSLHAAQVS